MELAREVMKLPAWEVFACFLLFMLYSTANRSFLDNCVYNMDLLMISSTIHCYERKKE